VSKVKKRLLFVIDSFVFFLHAFFHTAFIRAINYLFPVLSPFFTPVKRSLTDRT
jgi:hypothetical protein